MYKRQDIDITFKTTVTYPKGPDGTMGVRFDFLKNDETDLREIFTHDLTDFTKDEIEIKSLVNWYFFNVIMGESIRDFITAPVAFEIKENNENQIENIFTNLQNFGLEVNSGYEIVTLRRQHNHEMENEGMIKNIVDSDDVIFFGWRVPTIVDNHTASIEVMFRFTPQTNVPPDFKSSKLAITMESTNMKKLVALGYDGVEFTQEEYESNSSKHLMLDRVLLFDMKNSIPNNMKYLFKTEYEFSPIDTIKYDMEFKYLLSQAQVLDYSSLIEEGGNFDPTTVYPEAVEMRDERDNKLTVKLIKEFSVALIKLYYAQIFDNMSVIKAINLDHLKNISSVELIESNGPGGSEDDLLETNGLYEYYLSVYFDENEIDNPDVIEMLKDSVQRLNSMILMVKKVPFEKDYLEKYAAGFMVQIELYFDKIAYAQFGTDSYQFFKGVPVDRNSSPVEEEIIGENVSESSQEAIDEKSNQIEPDGLNESIDEKLDEVDENTLNETHDELLDESLDEQDIVGKEVEEDYRGDIDSYFPFEKTYADVLESIDAKGEPVQGYNMKLSLYFIKQFMIGVWDRLELTNEDVEDSRYFELSVYSPTAQKLVNEKIIDDSKKLEKDLASSTIDARIVQNASINSIEYPEVDQITYMVKMNDGVYYMIFRMERRTSTSWKLNEYNFEFFLHHSGKKEDFAPPDLDNPEIPTQFSNSIFVIESALMEKKFIHDLTEMVDSFALKRRNVILPITFHDFKDQEPKFEDNQEGPEDSITFKYDMDSRQYQYDLMTFPFSEHRNEPRLKSKPQSPKYGFMNKERIDLLDDHDFSGNNHFLVSAKFESNNLSENSEERAEQLTKFDKLVFSFKLEMGACPDDFVTSFQFLASYSCQKIFSNGKYMLEFKDLADGDFANKVSIERVMRVYTFWPSLEKFDEYDDENELDDETLEKIDKQKYDYKRKNNNKELGFTTYEKELTYRFMLINSIHLDTILDDPAGHEVSEEELRLEADKLKTMFDSVEDNQGKNPTNVSKETLENIVKAISIEENDAIRMEKEFQNLFPEGIVGNESMFGTMANGMIVQNFQGNDSFMDLPETVDNGVFKMKVEMDEHKFEKERLITFLKENAEFFTKIMHLETEEKYEVAVSDYKHLNYGNARLNVGKQVIVKLQQINDQDWKIKKALKDLLIL